MRLPLRAATLALLLASAACISASQSGGGSLAARDGTKITADEIRSSRRANALELVQALRPEWLRKRSNTSTLRRARVSYSGPDDVLAYLDGQRLGTVESLRSIPVDDVEMIRHYTASGAQQRFGDGHPNGAIEIITRRGGS
ncbi:MAG TPA: hypothetical protein VF584_02820 [Longimicrobium sp.]|jgi:hypothetical protein